MNYYVTRFKYSPNAVARHGLLAILVLSSSCGGEHSHRSTGQHIYDGATSMRVRDALKEDAPYKYNRVKVSTFKARVRLDGFVNTKEEKSRAARIAKRVHGVFRVQNNLAVNELP